MRAWRACVPCLGWVWVGGLTDSADWIDPGSIDRSTDGRIDRPSFHPRQPHERHLTTLIPPQTPNAKAYVAKITEAFHAGLLPLQVGTTLRSYLSDKLNWCVACSIYDRDLCMYVYMYVCVVVVVVVVVVVCVCVCVHVYV